MADIVGYVELPADIVFDACEAYFKDRAEREEKEKQAAIKYEMSKRWFPAKTEEAALERTKDMFGYSWRLGGTYWANQVGTLKTCCNTTSGNVLVDMDVLEVIEPFMRKATR